MNRRPHTALTAVLALSAGLLTGCGSNQPNGGAPTPFDALTTPPSGTTSSPGTTPAAPPPKPVRLSAAAAGAKLATARKRHLKADTGAFVQDLVIEAGADGTLTTRLEGQYRVSTRSTAGTLVNTGSGALKTQLGAANGAEFRTRIIKDVVYLNVPGGPARMRNCWTKATTGEALAAAGLEKNREGAPMPVANLDTLTSAIASGGVGDELTGSVAVLNSLQLFGPGVVRKLKRPERLAGRLPATFRIGPDGVEKFTIPGAGMAAVLVRTKQGLAKTDLALVKAMTVTVTYSDWRLPVSIQHPATPLILKPGRQSCGP